jgi:hypothetical protein
MKRMVTLAGTAASLAMLALAPASIASGGRPAGSAAGGGGAPVVAPTGGGGGGGGGGGASSGGIKDVAPVPVPPPPPVVLAPPCATFTSATAPVGYYLSWAAVWNDFTIRSCSASPQTYSVHVTESDVATGLVGYDTTAAYSVGASQQVSGILDNDFAPFDTTYTISMTVSDSSGNVLDSRTLGAVTLPRP